MRYGSPSPLLPGDVVPFTQQIHDAQRWEAWVSGLGGQPVHLVWVRSDAATLWQRLAARGLERDFGKLADFAAFAASMQLHERPAAPHVTIDNRLGAADPLDAQVAGLLAHLPIS